MRIGVELNLEHELIDKDKNRMILHLLKSLFEKYDKKLYRKYYDIPKRKKFTFSLYLGKDIKFLREYIHIPRRKINLNLSAYDDEEMTRIYNCFENAKGKVFLISDNSIKIGNIKVLEEREIINNMIFKTMSPISVREHDGNNKNTWYYNIESEKGYEVFLNNLKYQIKEELDEDIDINIKVLNNKLIKIKHYDIVIPANKCKLGMSGSLKQIEYLYKSGIGSNKSSGFGMLS